MAFFMIAETWGLHTSGPRGDTCPASASGRFPDKRWYRVAPRLYRSERTSSITVLRPDTDLLPESEEGSWLAAMVFVSPSMVSVGPLSRVLVASPAYSMP